jgi:hypothetical protein
MGASSTAATDSTRLFWSLLGGDASLLDALTVEGPASILPSVFDVTGFAASAIGVATLAAAELLQARTSGRLRRVTLGTVEAAAAFRSEALFSPDGWKLPPVWDPIAGDYRAADRWIRLHTNYASHRDAVLAVLGTPPERASIVPVVARWDAAELEAAIVEAGGCAAAMYSRREWEEHPHGAATLGERPISLSDDGHAARAHHRGTAALPERARPLEGVRVLDLTRVIAGPVCTQFLAAHGADVLRIDPPGFEEVPALLPMTTAGKRCAALSLATPDGAARLDDLLASADVIVHGLRTGALERLGFDRARLRSRNPALVIATLDAYGWAGPWRSRRAFDSLVQMSSGIAAAPGGDRPSPLPAQALDHGVGYLLAAGVCRALTRLISNDSVATIRGSLLGAANHLLTLPSPAPPANVPPWPDHVYEDVETHWGAARRVRCPGEIEGVSRPSCVRVAAPLGSHEASF